MTDLLTPAEHTAAHELAFVADLLRGIVLAGGDGNQAVADLERLLVPLYAVRAAVLAQAAARAYPGQYRLLGASPGDAAPPSPPPDLADDGGFVVTATPAVVHGRTGPTREQTLSGTPGVPPLDVVFRDCRCGAQITSVDDDEAASRLELLWSQHLAAAVADGGRVEDAWTGDES